MKIYELIDDDLNEGQIAKWAALMGLSAAAGAGLGVYTQPDKPAVSPTITTTQTSSPSQASSSSSQTQRPAQAQAQTSVNQKKLVQPVTGSFTAITADKRMQDFLKNYAIRAGLRGNELAAFLAQTAHESAGFRRLEELGDKEYFENLYDINGSPNNKSAILGNTVAGDGVKYRGRGFIHITGKENYKKVGKALNLPLEDSPDLASDPENAAKIAVWFWKNKVRPIVKNNWNNVRSVTYKINPAMKNIDDREANYLYYQKLFTPKKKIKKPQRT